MNDQMRPFLFVPRYWPALGGAELHSRRLAQELALQVPVEVARCCSTEAVATDYAFASAKPERVEDGPMSVRTIAPPPVWRPALAGLAGAAETSRLARGLYGRAARLAAAASFRPMVQDADLVHGIYNGFTPGAEALRSLGKPFVWTPLAHTSQPEGTAWSSPGFRRLYRKADALIAMTEYERDWLIGQGATSSRVHVAPMAPLFGSDVPNPAAFRRRFGIGDAPFVLFLGRTAKYKGYRDVLEASRQVWQRHREVRFIFAGPLTSEAETAFAEYDDPRIIVTGALSEAEKKSALAACTMLAVPSTQESLGVVYLEAWSFEKPVIAADIPAMRSVIDHEGDGLIVAQDGGAVAVAVERLLQSPEFARKAGQQGARKVEVRYNWAAIADAHLKIYASIL